LQLLASIFKKRGFADSEIVPILLLAGGTWGFLRFTSENEVYILPIALSLAGILALEKGKGNEPNYLMAGFWLALACLFHQVQFWWWLFGLVGVAIYYRSGLLRFALPALIVPLGYLLVHVLAWNQPLTIDSLTHSFFQAYVDGGLMKVSAQQTLILESAGIFRSFLQVHGYLTLLPELDMKWYLALVLFPLALLYLGFQIIKNRKEIQFEIQKLGWLLPLFLVGFSLFSGGNAEFLAGLPIALLLWLRPKCADQSFRNFAIWVLAYNIVFGLAPLNRYAFNPFSQEAAFIAENPNALYVSDNATEINGILLYKLGADAPQGMPGVVGIPADTNLTNALTLASKNRQRIFTSCLNQLPLSRASYLQQPNKWWLKHRLSARRTLTYANQEWVIWELRDKTQPILSY